MTNIARNSKKVFTFMNYEHRLAGGIRVEQDFGRGLRRAAFTEVGTIGTVRGLCSRDRVTLINLLLNYLIIVLIVDINYKSYNRYRFRRREAEVGVIMHHVRETSVLLWE